MTVYEPSELVKVLMPLCLQELLMGLVHVLMKRPEDKGDCFDSVRSVSPPMATPPLPPLPLFPTAMPPFPLKSPEFLLPPLALLPLLSPPSPPAPPTTALFPDHNKTMCFRGNKPGRHCRTKDRECSNEANNARQAAANRAVRGPASTRVVDSVE